MADELEFVCEKCVHYEVCDRSSRMIWARLSKEKVCTDFMEVVRCKECHWWRKINAKNGCGICRHEVFSVDDCTVDPVTEPNDFCSYGERKTE